MRVKSDKCTNGPMKSKVDASPLLVFNGTGGMSKATKIICKHASLLSTVPGMRATLQTCCVIIRIQYHLSFLLLYSTVMCIRRSRKMTVFFS